MRHSICIRNSPQWYDLGFGAAIDWKSDDTVSLVFMICDEDYDKNVETDNIILFQDDWDTEYYMDTPLTLHMREY